MRVITAVFAMIVAIALFVPTNPAHALLTTGYQVCDPAGSTTLGDCTFSPNDSASELESILESTLGGDFTINFIAKWENGSTTGESFGTISFSNEIVNGEGEILAADWTYTPPGGSTQVVSYLAVKAGDTHAYFDYTGSDMPNQGYFDVACLFLQVCQNDTRDTLSALNRDGLNAMSHVTAYTPLPAAIWLFLSALAGLFGIGYKRRSSAA
jgi:hypothetical protein